MGQYLSSLSTCIVLKKTGKQPRHELLQNVGFDLVPAYFYCFFLVLWSFLLVAIASILSLLSLLFFVCCF